jgi:hypothetical protein
MALATVAVTSPRPNSTREFNRKFAVGMAVALFAVNFAGFVPTFFLRPFFDVPEVPLYLYLHGAVGTAWFLLVAQGVNAAFQLSGIGPAIVSYRLANL